MDREDILNAIRKTADANGGKPLGRRRFADMNCRQFSSWKLRNTQVALPIAVDDG